MSNSGEATTAGESTGVAGAFSVERFDERPILNSPYESPDRHWQLDASGQPTQKVLAYRRPASLVSPIPNPKQKKTRKGPRVEQVGLVLDKGKGLSTEEQQYLATIINRVRERVNEWRRIPDEADWRVTPETARLLRHWRSHRFSGIRPFFCQIEAVETAIWLTEVAPLQKAGRELLEHMADASEEANLTPVFHGWRSRWRRKFLIAVLNWEAKSRGGQGRLLLDPHPLRGLSRAEHESGYEHITPVNRRGSRRVEGWSGDEPRKRGGSGAARAQESEGVGAARLHAWWQKAQILAGLDPKPGRGWHSLRRKFASELMDHPERRDAIKCYPAGSIVVTW